MTRCIKSFMPKLSVAGRAANSDGAEYGALPDSAADGAEDEVNRLGHETSRTLRCAPIWKNCNTVG